MFRETVSAKVKKLDFYRKMPKDLTESTLSGALVSIIALSCISLLFLSELSRYMQISTTSEMFVDTNRGGEQLEINIDVEFPHYPCGLIGLDAQDVMGSHIVDIGGSLQKIRLSSSGEIISEENMKTSKVLSIEKMRKQLDENEGCRVAGHILVNKVPGNFHFSSHAYQAQISKLVGVNSPRLDFSHKIHHISFGGNSDIELIKQSFQEGILDPLDSTEQIRGPDNNVPINYQYYAKVVPTTYRMIWGKEYHVHQFSANTNQYPAKGHPSLYFKYDLSPVTVRFSQHRENLFHFIVQLCAIVGGVFTVAGLIDNFLHTSISTIAKKPSTGKLG